MFYTPESHTTSLDILNSSRTETIPEAISCVTSISPRELEPPREDEVSGLTLVDLANL